MNPIADAKRRFAQLRNTYGRFAELVRKERALLALAGAAVLCEIAFDLLAPWPIKYIFDGLLIPAPDGPGPFVPASFPREHPEWFLALSCGAILLFALCAGVAGYYRQIWGATAGQRMVFKLRKRLYAHMQMLSLRFHRDSHLGDLLLRITGDIAMLRDILSTALVEIAGRTATIIIMVTVLLFLDPALALVSVAVMIAVSLLSSISARKITRVTKEQREKEGVIAHLAGEALAAMPLVKAYGCEERMVENFARQNRASMRKSLKGTRLQAALERRVEFIFAAGIAVVFAFGVFRVGAGLTAGELLVFVSYFHRLNKPLRKMASTANRIGKAAACGERIIEILALAPEEVDRDGARPAPVLSGALRFDDVSFGYEPARLVLERVSFAIPAGQRVALVGRNGAGKSTLVHLVLRFFEPRNGRILFDGVDARDFQIRSLRERISLALQSTLLFGTSIRENLLCAAPDATDAEMERALAAAGADFVRRLPAGLDSGLADRGANLSGGECRKLALAAAVLRRAPILILDEPTTHIDHASREEIVRRLPRLAEGRTCIAITHDVELLQSMDRILYLADGKLAGDGTHEELLVSSPEYRALFAADPAPEGVPRA
ncbi:MAG: ABC transporter ATP-binding protein/permease [Planctomycetes bacterium]|nr:ABC transporter ATP-binding protein/permease [Planctomycetota bacterium]